MSNEQDMLIWKLQNDLTRARLALGRIYHIVSKVYCPEEKHAMSSIHRDNVDKIVETLQEFFNEDYERKVTVEKTVFDVLQKNNLDLMEKLEKAKEALRFYSDSDCYEKCGSYGTSEIDEDGGEWARKVLEEIDK